jgi:hypothetical protein
MESQFSGGQFRPEELYKASAERFFELLKSFATPGPAAAGGAARDWSQMAGVLATQLEEWLRMSQSAGSWFSAPGAAAAGAAPGLMGAQWPFGPLPLGPAAVQKPETQRIWELAARFAQLQTQLAAH